MNFHEKIPKLILAVYLVCLASKSFAAGTVVKRNYNVDKETVYYSDNTKVILSSTSNAKSYSGSNEIVTYTFADGTVNVVTNISKSNVKSFSGSNEVITYKFMDGTTNVVSNSYTSSAKTYSGSSEVLTYKFADGMKNVVIKPFISFMKLYNGGNESVTYNFADGSSNSIINAAIDSTKSYIGSQEYVTYKFADGTSNLTVKSAIDSAISWRSDHITKTTVYNFADGTTNRVLTKVPGSIGLPSYSGGVETKVTTYGDGTTSTATFNATRKVTTYSGPSEIITYQFSDGTINQVLNTALSNTTTWADDHVTMITTYIFSDSTTNRVSSTVPGNIGLPSYSGGVETKVTTYGDGTASTATFNATGRITTYSGSSEIITYQFSDGTTNQVVNTALSNTTTWADDHVTMTTTYIFPDSTTNRVSSIVPGSIGLPSYSRGVETKVTTYGDGTTSTATFNAIGATTTYSGSTAIVTYQFADGTTNIVTNIGQLTYKAPIFTAAIYPNDWSTNGGVSFPSTSAATNTDGDANSIIIEDGSISHPFNQSTLTPNGPTGSGAINDPNAVVKTANIIYNLTWGNPDKNGPSYSLIFPRSTTRLPSNFNWLGISLNGSNTSIGAALLQPNLDVLTAWNHGWTGKGENLLVLDDLNGLNAGTSSHAFATTFIAGYYTAHGSNTYILDYNLTGNIYATSPSKMTATPASTSIQIINASYEVLPSTTVATSHINFYNGARSVADLSVTDATIVMAAGNAPSGSSASATSDNATRMAMVNDSSINPRLILVGATNLSFLGFPQLASYSNYAGPKIDVQSRFLVASGNVPWAYTATTIGNNMPSSTYGTSYAAPLVAGYAAIVRQKFPNLSGANAADILLATARYDTLSCYPNCDKAQYGQGEASLSRALAPVGYLR